MAKFNAKKNSSSKTLSFEGGTVYEYSGVKDKLTMAVVNNFMGEPSFYNYNDKEVIDECIEKLAKVDPEFVLKLAKYTRKELHMRSVAQYLIVALVNQPSAKGLPGIRKRIADFIERPDDMTEMIACQLSQFGKPIPTSLKYGIAQGFTKFDAYQLAKYQKKGSEVTLRDVMFLTHPAAPTQELEQVYKELADNEMKPADTWEVKISTQGSTYESWKEIIPRMGHMAMLRNLNNFEKVGISLSEIKDKFTKEAVLRGKQLPFRYYTAYKNGNPKFRSLVEMSMEFAVENLPKFSGKTAILVDVSGSMSSPVSGKSDMWCVEIASLLGAVVARKSDSYIVPFASYAKTVNPNDYSIIELPKVFRVLSHELGYGTNIDEALSLVENDKELERVVILSDMQVHPGDYDTKIKKLLKRGVQFYAIDLRHYGTKLFTQHPNYYTFGGWSEKIVDFIAMGEDIRNMSKVVESYDG